MKRMYIKKALSVAMASAFAVTSVPAAALAANDVSAAEAATLIADFTFDDEASGFAGADAKASGNHTLQEIDGRKAVYLDGRDDFLTVTKSDGSSLLTGATEVSVSFDVKQDQDGTNWAFYAAPNTNTQTESTIRYLGVLLKGTSVEVERFNRKRAGSAVYSGITKEWTHFDVLYSEEMTSVYVNGKKAVDWSGTAALTDILESSSILYIGKANWVNGEYMKGWLDNYKIYSGLLTEAQIQEGAGTMNTDIVAKDKEALTLPEYVTKDFELPSTGEYGSQLTWNMEENSAITIDGNKAKVTRGSKDVTVNFTVTIKSGDVTDTKTMSVTVRGLTPENALEEAKEQLDIPNKDDVRGNITLPSSVGNVKVTWTTDHPEIVNVNEIPATVEGYDSTPAGTVTRPEKNTVVTMTAALQFESYTSTKKIKLKVKAAPEEKKDEDYTDYFFPYFAGEGYSDGEQLYFSASQDGLHWTDLNDNKPVLYSTLGEKGVRDPFIMRSYEGDKFYMIATDLKINGGNGWGAAQNAGSQSLMVWESTDLVNWSEQRMVPVSAPIDSGCTWAPEATYDELTGEYVVYWASKVKSDNYGKQRLYYAKTRDFYTFTEPKIFIDYDQSSIDTSILYENGTYYRFTKNEGDSNNQFGVGSKKIFEEKATTLLGKYTHIPSDSLNANGGVEGPSIFKLNADDRTDEAVYCLLVDNYGAGGYYPLLSTDLESGVFVRPSIDKYKMPSRARHGTPIRVTSDEYNRVMKQWTQEEVAGYDEDSKLDALVTAEQDAGLKAEDYTSETWAAYESALSEAQDILAKESAKPAEVSAAIEKLTDARSFLQEKSSAPAVKKDALKAAIEEAKQKAPESSSEKYTEDSWTDYMNALIKANDTYEDPDAAQDDVDEAAAALTAALDGLVEKGSEPDPGPEPEVDVNEWFTDVNPSGDNNWPVPEIQDVFDRGIMKGLDYEHHIFGTETNLSRAHLALMLWRHAGNGEVGPKPDGKTIDFKDVAADADYAEAVAWASSENVGIVKGYKDEKGNPTGFFDPAAGITREQLSLMMLRYAKYLKCAAAQEDAPEDALSKFTDLDKINPYDDGEARKALAWVVKNEIVQGEGGTTLLNPQGKVNRAVAATFFSRLLSNVVEAQ